MTDLILHEYARSGNCYKIRLTAAHLGIALERREYDIMTGGTRTPAFLAEVSANGRIPVLQIGDFFLPESNAACVYLARESALVPDDALEFADMLRWMFWEQYNHETCVAVLRFWRGFIGEANLSDLQRAQLPGKVEAAAAALALMEDHLASRPFFVGGRFTLADIGLYAYTHVAGEGGIDLSPYPAIVGWLGRVAAQPGHIAITA